RKRLIPFAPSIPSEGVRLFVASPTVAAVAAELVDEWISLWTSLEDLREALPEADRVWVKKTAEQLVTADLHVVVDNAQNAAAYVGPLHPIVLEPRLRAASLFREFPDLDEQLLTLIADTVDPAAPSITVSFDGVPKPLAFTQSYKGLMRFGSENEFV